MKETDLIQDYRSSSAEKRVEIIIKNYPKFLGIIDGYTEGLKYMIESEKESNRHREKGELGVRVQTGGMKADPTEREATDNVITTDALVKCKFSDNVLYGVERPEIYIKAAETLRAMRKDYTLFNSQLQSLGEDRDMFVRYISKKATLVVLAEEKGVCYETVQQKIVKIKHSLKKLVAGFMKSRKGDIF